MKAALFSTALVALFLIGQNQPASARRRFERSQRFYQVQSESHIPQIPENLREPPDHPIPELATQPNAKQQNAQGQGGVACTAENANSPQCYTATQQSRPATK